MAERTSPLINTATTLGKVIAFFLGSAVAGTLVAGTMVPLAVGASKATEVAAGAYDSIEIPSENAAIAQPSVLLDRDGNQLAKFYVQNRKNVSLKNISPWMQKAIVSIEDERFYEHGGVDARGIARALVSNLSGGGQQGASTITQQYVANLNVNNEQAAGKADSEIARNGNKDIADKVKEIKWANEIETKMSKDQILQGYLNLVPFAGATYGVEAASQRWFSKSASKLSIAEAATLAGMVQRPMRFNPTNNPQATLQRRNIVLGAMLKTGAITQGQYNKAVKSKLTIDPSEDSSGCEAAGSAGYFCSYVFQQISADPTFGKTVQARQSLVLRGGLTIKTSLDPKLQEVAAKEVQNTVPIGDKGGMGAALVTRNNKTGEILAMAQNTTYGTDKKKPETYTEVNFNTSSYQGGSTAKPWTTVAWLEAGHSMGDTVKATRMDYTGTTWDAKCLADGKYFQTTEWKPGNATAGTNKLMTASAGLYWSINTATIAEAYELDLCDIGDVPSRLGLLEGQTTPVGTKIVTASAKALASSGPAFVIGAQTVTPLAQARAFGAYASEGQLCDNVYLLSVKRPNGKEIDVPKTTCKEVIEPDVVKKLNGTLKQIAGTRVAQGTINASIGGKTGTNNYATSTWFAGYSSDLTTISWVGRKDGKIYNAANKIYGLNSGGTIKGQTYPNADSSYFASPLWKRYMQQVIHEYPTETIPSVGPFYSSFSAGLSGTGTSGSSGSSGSGSSGSNGSTAKSTGSTAGSSSAGTESSASNTSAQNTDKSKPEKTQTPEKTKQPEKTKEPANTKTPEKTKSPDKSNG